MPSAEIIAIGTELLLGEIQDSNTRYIARTFRSINLDLYRSTIIGDNLNRISETIKEALSRSDIVLTCGGLGPTIDDPTREAVANAVGVKPVYLPELWKQIEDRFKKYGRTPTENNRRQAFIPEGAIPLSNPVGTAPCFIVEHGQKCIISLPGVPKEMENILDQQVVPYLINHYQLTGVIKVCVIHAAGAGESVIDEKIADLETYTNPTVGLLAHPGQTDIRITAKANSEAEAIAQIDRLRSIIMERIGEHVYGFDGDTLENVVQELLNQRNRPLTMIEYGLNKLFIDCIQKGLSTQLRNYVFSTEELDLFQSLCKTEMENNFSDLLILDYKEPSGWPEITVTLILDGKINHIHRNYGGPISYAPLWATNMALDFLRRCLINS